MDSFNNDQHSSNGLEDRLRRMILLNGSVPDDSDHIPAPRVRLPPPPPSVDPGTTRSNQNTSAQYHPSGPWEESGQGSPSLPPAPRFAPPIHASSQVLNHATHLPNQSYTDPHQGRPTQHRPGTHHGRGPSHVRPAQSHRGGVPRPNQQRREQVPLDSNAYSRRGLAHVQNRSHSDGRNLYEPGAQPRQPNYGHTNDTRERQAGYLEQIAAAEIPAVDMSESERAEKESFRQALDNVCQQVCAANPDLPNVSLECFGSFKSGFASAGSDMDLVIVVKGQDPTGTCFSILEHDLPRSLEKELLRKGFGARLLTQTRVPIIKICQNPGDSLLDSLRENREKWDFLPNEKKYPHLHKGEDEAGGDEPSLTVDHPDSRAGAGLTSVRESVEPKAETTDLANGADQGATPSTTLKGVSTDNAKRDQSKTWTRERKSGPLDFPKEGVGIQCDINFFNPLGLHNTQMLRCYSMCDPRVRAMVLFVKSWAKQRKINSSYSGTLSSYGYVMMVLHYLMNVAQPPVLPNLQLPWRPNPNCTPPGYHKTKVDGWDVDFWRNEDEIQDALRAGQMSSNKESLGALLSGFFQYYSSLGNGPQFHWTQWVLSLRTPRGIMTKESKGWVKAITEERDGKRIQHRYLFCIEDPFELGHNVARTVTHPGIVAIRDEFRRAYRILGAVGMGVPSPEGELFAQLVEAEPEPVDLPTDFVGGSIGEPFEKTKAKPTDKQHISGELPGRHQTGPQHRYPLRNGSIPGKASDQHKNTHSTKDKSQNLDVQDQDSFPTLGKAKTTNRRERGRGGRAAGKNRDNNSKSNGVSGDQTATSVEESQCKKAEAQAETTAHGIAESVLSGDD